MISFDEAKRIADIVNSAGGRRRDIVKVISCDGEECGAIFFGQPQDMGMREAIEARTLCPNCRSREPARKKREKSERARVLGDGSTILQYESNGQIREFEFYAKLLKARKINQYVIRVETEEGVYDLMNTHVLSAEPFATTVRGIPLDELAARAHRES
ncbi:hypothetical protein [Cohnella soli]|uniref:Uncharacterized protein n=1 Tax=Cohnella soli TaxID=425005 RepID=A0ABW0HM16_9BACL